MSSDTIHHILKQYWGYNTFRPQQEAIIQSILEGNDTLALLPTGGGKSICFQIPALVQEGICIVISPLVALMQDQVESLNQKGIKALYVHSGLSKRQIDIALDNAVYGNYKFLYVSPERIETALFRERVKKMNVSMVAVDEAHCISQWGYDFRPSYLNIVQLREALAKVPFIALTASATEAVVEDIQKQLDFKRRNVIQRSFFRKNLSYVVRQTEDVDKELLKVIQGVGGSGIVYVSQRKKAEVISKLLQMKGYKAHFYHAGLEFEERKRKQGDWISSNTSIMVATNAFGMGIDKSNVRFVVHIDLPSSMEAYYQEAGRAGRDGKKSYAVVLYNKASLTNLIDRIIKKYPPKEKIKEVYHSLCNFLQIPYGGGEGEVFKLDFNEFLHRYEFQKGMVINAFELLNREGLLLWEASTYTPSVLKIVAKQKDLFAFQETHPIYSQLISTMLRLYGGIYEMPVQIDERTVGKALNQSHEWVMEKLMHLEKMELINYSPQSNLSRISFSRQRLELSQIILSKENYHDRKKKDNSDIQAIKYYLTQKNRCRSQELLYYFGDFSQKSCGICDVCVSAKKNELTNQKYQILEEKIVELLEKEEPSLKRIISAFPTFEEAEIIEALNFMMDNQHIDHRHAKYYLSKKD